MRQAILTHRLIEQLLTPEPRPHISQRAVVTEPCAKLHEREPRVVLTLAAIPTVVVAVVDVRECHGLEGGEFHACEGSAPALWIAPGYLIQ